MYVCIYIYIYIHTMPYFLFSGSLRDLAVAVAVETSFERYYVSNK